MEFILCIRHFNWWSDSSAIFLRCIAGTGSSSINDGTCCVWYYELQWPCAKAVIQLAAFVFATGFYNDGVWWIFGGLRHPLCRRMYQRPRHHRFVHFAMAFFNCHLLFYDWWFYYGQFNYALYSFSLKKYK